MPDSAGNPAGESGRGHPIARALLFMMWTRVFWGTLIAVSFVWRSVELGPSAALRMLIVGTPGVPPSLGRFSLVCAVIAVAVWTTVAVLLVKSRKAAGPDDGAGS